MHALASAVTLHRIHRQLTPWQRCRIASTGDTVAAEAAIHLAELRGKRDQVAKQVHRITELQRTVDDANAELQSKQGHTDVINAQMSEITRLRNEARSLSARMSEVEAECNATELTFKQQQDAQTARHAGELAAMHADQVSLNARLARADQEKRGNADRLVEVEAAAVGVMFLVVLVLLVYLLFCGVL